jgi:hypothetical protein
VTSSWVPESPDPNSDIQFVLNDKYKQRETADISIKNVGKNAYLFDSCYDLLSFKNSSGEEFLIPEISGGCDLKITQTIRPGETAKLYSWDLDKCVDCNMGCLKSNPLDPGFYTVKAKFSIDDGKTFTVTEKKFEIVK